MIQHREWRWFGNAAHFIAAPDCRFHMATQVGRVIISTIGDYSPSGISHGVLRQNAEGFTEIGWQRYFETYVFEVSDTPCECGCGLPKIVKWSEIDSRGWQTRAEANRGHLEVCEHWACLDQDARLAPNDPSIEVTS